jgi:ferredoxin/flavodoxin
MHRREFIKKTFIAAAALAASGAACASRKSFREKTMKTLKPKRALAVWYSQTGHTERIGRLIAKVWEKSGLIVTSGDIREIDPKTVSGYDIIAAGSPVFYYEIPVHAVKWLESIPVIDGTPVASFVTYGGKGNNQQNTACMILDLLANKGGVPVGREMYGNMSAFAPEWSLGEGNLKKILGFSHLPDENTYKRVRAYAMEVIGNVMKGKSIDIDHEISGYNMLRSIGPAWWTRKLIGKHEIDRSKCIKCGTCVYKCPVAAIDLSVQTVDVNKCVACMGCVNNCPVQAVVMTFMGKNVYGYNVFLERNKIRIREPEEIKS